MDYSLKVNIEKHLSVELPQSLDLTFQIFPAYSEEDEIICGWAGEQLVYLLTADEQPGGFDDEFYWSGMEKTLRESTPSRNFSTLKKGSYLTNSNHPVSYPVYKRKFMGEDEIYLYHLIKNEKIAYWVMATVINLSDIFKISSEVNIIMKTAILTKH